MTNKIAQFEVSLVLDPNVNLPERKLEGREVERRGEEKNLPLKIDSKGEPNPTKEPNPIHVENSSQGKTRPYFFKPARWFDAKTLPPKTPHEMSECSD